MGELTIRRITANDRIDTCDNCQQQGLYASGKEVRDRHSETVLWFCYNCIENKKVQVS